MKLNNRFLIIAGNVIFILGAVYGLVVLFDFFSVESIENNFSGSMTLMIVGWVLSLVGRSRESNETPS